MGLDVHYGGLLGLFAARLLHQVKHSGGKSTLQVVLDLDADTDPINVLPCLSASAHMHRSQTLSAPSAGAEAGPEPS